MKKLVSAVATFLGLFLVSFGLLDTVTGFGAKLPPGKIASLFGQGCGVCRPTRTACAAFWGCTTGAFYSVTGTPPGNSPIVTSCPNTSCGAGRHATPICNGG